MGRPKEKILEMLKEQMGLLRTSLDAFYAGNFSESLRIATIIRVLVHETGSSKPLLKQVRSDALDLEILEHADQGSPAHDEIMRFAVSVRLGPGPTVAPAVDLRSTHYSLSSLGSWWRRTVFTFPSKLATRVVYTRRQVILSLANREGGAHVDPNEDPNYSRLLNDAPLVFAFGEHRVETPDLARFLSAQSGVEMLEFLKRNFFGDSSMPSKWEYGEPPPVAAYLDEIAVTATRVVPAFPVAEVEITHRG